MSKQKTILIFYIKAGGGHESAAKAIKKEFSQYEHNIILIDMLSASPKWVQNLFDAGYVKLTEKHISTWLILNRLWEYRWFNLISYFFLKVVAKPNIKKQIEKYKPEMILSTYFFGAKFAQSILDQKNIKIPNFTIVTEIFDAPKIWFTFPGNFITFSDLAEKIATQQTQIYQTQSQIHRFNYFFNSEFNTLIQPNNLKSNNKFSILILGGGSSLPRGEILLSKILEIDQDINLNLVCGRNQELYQKCQVIQNEKTNVRIDLTIWPFTDKIPALIANCDLVVTKGGPAVIFESLSQIKPILIYDYIKPQEKGNVDFVVNNNFGFYEPNLDKLKILISQIITDPTTLDTYLSLIKKSNIKSSSPELIQYLESVIDLQVL